MGEVSHSLGAVDPGPEAFGAAGRGELGELGRGLHLLWRRALDARAREALGHGDRLEEMGQAVATASQRYAETDDPVHRRARGGL
jgi:hypothetical protein